MYQKKGERNNKMLTVNELYQLHKKINPDTPFLSSLSADWWQTYITNFKLYDKHFVSLFKSFLYFNQADQYEYNETEKTEILNDFQDMVTGHLMLNSEKYRQLWRVENVPDEQNELYENVNSIEKTTTTYGKIIDYTRAEKKDVHDHSGDAYTDTLDSKSDNYTDVTNAENGKQHIKTENKTAGFNSSDYSPDGVSDVSNDAYTDKSTLNAGARHGISTNNYGKTHTTDTDTFGAHNDKDSNSGSDVVEYMRHGNIGVETVAEIEAKHADFWKNWSFYDYIFKKISEELFLVG